jgi:plasmid replication initiation protein
LSPAVTLVSCLAYSSTLKIEKTHSSETVANFEWTTWCYIPEDRTLHNHHCENLKSYIINMVVLQTSYILPQTEMVQQSGNCEM